MTVKARAAWVAAVLSVGTGLVGASSAAAAPGSPGVPGPPQVVFTEDFENVPNQTNAHLLPSYTGAPPLAMTYTAHSAWLNTAACNGVIGSWNAATTAGSCSAGIYNAYIRPIARGMGAALGGGDNNHVMSDVTASGFPAPATPAATLQTVKPIPLPATNRFVTFSVSAGAVTCGLARPLLRFFLLDGSTQIPASNNAIDACTDPRGISISGVRVGTYASDASNLVSSSEIGLKLTNDQTSGNGNDYAVDNIRVLDSTPQLDKEFVSPGVSGQPATLRFTVTNTNDFAAKPGWSFTDTLPAGLTVATPSGVVDDCNGGAVTATPGGGSIQVSGNLLAGAANATCTVEVDVVSPVPGSFQNCPANISNLVGLDPPACDTLVVEPGSDLELTKSANPDVVDPGDQTTFTLEATNNGPDPEPDASITDTLPAGLTYVSDDGACDTSALPQITCDLGALAVGASDSVQITVQAGAGTGGSVLTNSATVAGANADTDSSNDTADADVRVRPLADLELVKSVTPGVVDPGDNATYSLEVTNNGPTDSPSATVTDDLPSGVTYVSDDAGCDTSALPQVTCTLGAIPSGSLQTIEIVVNVTAAGTVQANDASVSGPLNDPDPSNNADSADILVTPLADLSVTKTAPATARAGQEIIYTLAYANSGPTASPAVVEDTLPGGVTYVSDDSGCDTSALPLVTCAVGNVPVDGSGTIQIVVAVDPATRGTVANTGEISGPEDDPNLANNQDDASTEVAAPLADLRLEKSVSPGVADPGQPVIYTVTVENDGPDTARDVVVTDTLPVGLDPGTAPASCAFDAGARTYTCSLGDVPEPASVPLVFTATVQATAGGTVQQNTASVEAEGDDSTPANNTDTADLLVTPLSDLSVVKTAPATTRAGQQITYTLAWANDGPTSSPSTAVTDTLPAGVTYVSDDAGCDSSALPQLTCDLGALADGASGTIQVVVDVDAGTLGEVENTATIAGDNEDHDLSDNSDSATTDVTERLSDLSLEKSAPAGPFAVGEQITYTLTVKNDGPDSSAGTVVTDKLPAGLRYVSDDSGCAIAAASEVRCELGEIASGGSRVIKLVTQLDASSEAALTNSARVSGENADPDPADDSDSATTQTTAPPRTRQSKCFYGTKVTILGTNRPDRIVGTPGRDVINGRRGNDVILGLAGNDLICGGAGQDLIKGGRGDDRVKGSTGDDRIFGNRGGDWLRGAPGHDVITGRQGKDRLMGNRGDDRLRGRAGDDFLLGGPGTDWGSGGPGDDRGMSLETAFGVRLLK